MPRRTAWLAYWLHFLVITTWADDVEAARAEAAQHAEQAITLDAQDARGFAIAGHIRGHAATIGCERRLALHDRALGAEPKPGDGLGALGADADLSGRTGTRASGG